MKIRSRKNRNSIGIDIGHEKIRAVGISDNDNGVELVAFSEITSGLSRTNSGSVRITNSLDTNIFELLNNPRYGKFEKSSIVLSSPDGVSKSHKVKIPIRKFIGKKNRLDTFTKNGPESHYHEAHKIHTDYNEQGQQLDIYSIVGIEKSFYKNITESLDRHSFENLEISNQIDPLNYILAKIGNEKKIVVIDIGYFDTKIFTVDTVARMERHISMGAQSFIELLSKALNISEYESLVLLSKTGINESELGKKIYAATKLLLAGLVSEIASYLDELCDFLQIEKYELGKVLVSGELAMMPGFSEYLSTNTGISVEKIDPWEGTGTYPLKPMPKKIQPEYARAIALSLYGLRHS